MGLWKAVAVLCGVQGATVLGCNEPPGAGPPPAASSTGRARSVSSPEAAARNDAGSGGPGSVPVPDGGPGGAAAAVPSSAVAGSSPGATAPPRRQAPSDGERCTAARSETPVLLGTHPTHLRDLVEDRGGIYALGSNGWGDRRTIYRVARDGSGIRVLATLSSQQRDARLGLDPEAVYLSQQTRGEHAGGEALLRVSRAAGALETVAARFGSLAGVRDGFAYGVDLDPQAGTESVVRVPTAGGEVEVLHRRKLARVGYKGGPFRYLDAVVDAEGVYLADSGDGALVRVPLTGGDPVVVTGDRLAPCCLHVGAHQLFYSERSWDGNASVAKATGRREGPAQLEIWALATDGAETIVLGLDERSRRRVTVLGAHNEVVASAPMPHIFQTHAVVDDDCVYYSRVDPSGVSWFNAVARPKP